MEISIRPELAEFVRRNVERGAYPTADAMIEDALRLLRGRESSEDVRFEAIRQEIALGIVQADQGLTAPLDMNAIRAEVAVRIEGRTG